MKSVLKATKIWMTVFVCMLLTVWASPTQALTVDSDQPQIYLARGPDPLTTTRRIRLCIHPSQGARKLMTIQALCDVTSNLSMIDPKAITELESALRGRHRGPTRKSSPTPCCCHRCTVLAEIPTNLHADSSRAPEALASFTVSVASRLLPSPARSHLLQTALVSD
jgi:hypothetical protein